MTPKFEMFVLEGTHPHLRLPSQTESIQYHFFKHSEVEGIHVSANWSSVRTSDEDRKFSIFLPPETLDSIRTYQQDIGTSYMTFTEFQTYWFKTEDARTVWNSLVGSNFKRIG